MPLRRASALLAFGLLTLAAPGRSPAAVRAAPVERVETQGGAGTCGASAAVVRWTPERGPMARFVADTLMAATGDGVFIALGYTDDAFWSAEAHVPNDACDDCTQYQLVATSLKDGTRSAHTLVTDGDRNTLSGAGPAKLHAHVLGKLFHLANGAWPVGELQQDYSMRLPKRDADSHVEAYAGWFIEVGRSKAWRLLYDLHVGPLMCWCQYDWRAGKATTR